VTGGTVYVGGAFTSLGGQARSHIASLDAASGLPTSWDAGANGNVNAFAMGTGALYAGGAFTSMGDYPRASLAGVIPLESVDVPATVTDAYEPVRVSPNPTSSSARIDYTLPRPGHVRIGVYDTQGRRLAVPVDGARPAGRNSAVWNARAVGVRPGLYFVRIEAPGVQETSRLVFVE
jgi:hypothetical protein